MKDCTDDSANFAAFGVLVDSAFYPLWDDKMLSS